MGTKKYQLLWNPSNGQVQLNHNPNFIEIIGFDVADLILILIFFSPANLFLYEKVKCDGVETGVKKLLEPCRAAGLLDIQPPNQLGWSNVVSKKINTA